MTAHDPIDLSTVPQRYRFSQRDYLVLDAAGAFDDYGKTELIGGEILAVNARFSRHVRVQTRLFRAIAGACDELGGDLQGWLEGSLSISERNMPQPDIFVSRGLPDDGPIPIAQVALVIEVSDSTLKFDLEAKAALYASAGVPEYWVADIEGARIVQMWTPDSGTYSERGETRFGQRIAAATIDGLAVETTGI